MPSSPSSHLEAVPWSPRPPDIPARRSPGDRPGDRRRGRGRGPEGAAPAASASPTADVSTAGRVQAAPDRGPFRFEEVTKGSGVDFTYRNGEEAGHRTILESLGGGVALFDYDGDGRTDLFFPGGGHFMKEGKRFRVEGKPVRLYRNEGGWRFADVTAEAGLDRHLDV